MAVLIEANSVIIKMSAIHDKYPEGWVSFLENSPNQTLCADQHIVRIGFMSSVDVDSFMKILEQYGLVHLKDGKAQDIAVADQICGFKMPCNWAECGSIEFQEMSIKVCRAVGDESEELITPDGWRFEGSLSQTYVATPTEHVDKSLKFLRHETGLEVYLNMVTGEEVYLGVQTEDKFNVADDKRE